MRAMARKWMAGVMLAGVLLAGWAGWALPGSPAAAPAGNRYLLPSLSRDGIAGTAFYTVQPGDTLSSIGRAFGVSAQALAALNQMTDPDVLRAGAVIMIPLPTPTTAPTVTPTPGPSGPAQLVEHGSRSSDLVALTFDMGGRVDDAVAIVEWLVANRVEATIFMTGAMADNPNTDAGREVLALIDAHPALLDLGNHSYSHPDFRTLTETEMEVELVPTQLSARELCEGGLVAALAAVPPGEVAGDAPPAVLVRGVVGARDGELLERREV